MSNRYWEGHRDGSADMREKSDEWRKQDRDALEQCRVERDHNKEDATEFYAALKKLLAAKGDHMTACDRTMGATHPCTCGANEARQLLAGDTLPISQAKGSPDAWL